MKSTWPSVGIHTPASLRRANRRLDLQRQAVERQRQVAERVLSAMKQGASLHLQHGPSRAFWCLSNGQPVPADVATMVINHPGVVAVDDGLFHDIPGQTWRYLETKEKER